jgi:hypothetical protein
MKKKIVGILVCTLFILSAFCTTSYSEKIETLENIVSDCESCVDEHEIIITGQRINRRVIPEITYAGESPYDILNTLQPTVVIESPEDGAEVTEPYIIVEGYAASEIYMNYWEWLWEWEDGSQTGGEEIEPVGYYEFNIDIGPLAAGENTITVTFYDVEGGSGSDSVTVYYVGSEEGLLIESVFQPEQTVYPHDPKYGDDISGGPCWLECKLDIVAWKNTYLFGYPYNQRDHIDIKVHNNYKSDKTFTFVFKIMPDNKVIWRSDPVTVKAGERKTFTYKTPLPDKPFKWDVWSGPRQRAGSIVLYIDPDYTQPPADYRCKKVTVNVTLKLTHSLSVLFIPLTFKDGPPMHSNFTTEQGRRDFWNYLSDELIPWWNAIYPLKENSIIYSYNKENNMVRNISIWNTSKKPYRKVWVHDIASFQALNESEKNQFWAQFSKLAALQEGLHKDIAKDVKLYDRVIFLLPREALDNSDGLAVKSGPNENAKRGVMVAWTSSSGKPLRDCTPAHEIGHTYGLVDNYNWSKNYWGDPAVGYWVNKKIDVLLNPATTRDLMGYTNAIWSATNKTWIKKPNFKELIKRFNEQRDPEVILVCGFIDDKDNVNLSHWYSMEENYVDIEWGTPGDYLIKGYDSNDVILGEAGFNVNFVMSRDFVEDMVIDYTFFSFKLEKLPGLHRVDIIKVSTDEILASRTKTSNQPQVTFTKPSPGEEIKPGTYTITWTGSDPDGDILEYNIYLVKDDGENWSAVDLALSEKSTTADFTDLEKGNYQLIVVASDGWNTDRDIVSFKIKKGKDRSKAVDLQSLEYFSQRFPHLFPILRLLFQR